jgi:hypothetical protein
MGIRREGYACNRHCCRRDRIEGRRRLQFRKIGRVSGKSSLITAVIEAVDIDNEREFLADKTGICRSKNAGVIDALVIVPVAVAVAPAITGFTESISPDRTAAVTKRAAHRRDLLHDTKPGKQSIGLFFICMHYCRIHWPLSSRSAFKGNDFRYCASLSLECVLGLSFKLRDLERQASMLTFVLFQRPR